MAMFHLTDPNMATYLLSPHAEALLLRARQGYTQRMLQLYLLHETGVSVSQPTLSRWLRSSSARTFTPLPQDREYMHYLSLSRMSHPPRRYRRSLYRWRGLIQHLRQHGHSLQGILIALEAQGVRSSIRSIRRELATL